jgi:site-specific DNA-methyltransferase (adenine-specific)
MCVSIEDAGFEIRDMIAWCYGSGFPKSLDVSKAIDKAAGAEREVVGPGRWNHVKGSNKKQADCLIRPGGQHSETAPATPEAQQWDGWGTALKPALEPITVARKPFKGTVAANVLEHGTGAINVDGCRVEHVTVGDGNLALNPHLRSHINGGNGGNIIAHEKERRVVQPHVAGRWPANLIHDGSDDVVGVFPEAGGGFGTRGSAARFFYCAKASKAERGKDNPHPTVKPLALMRYLCRLVTPPGGLVLDPFMGTGTTGIAALEEGFRFIGIEREENYLEVARLRLATAGVPFTLT